MEGQRWPVAAAFILVGVLTAVLALFPPGAAAHPGPGVRTTTVARPAGSGSGSGNAPAVGCGG